MDQTFLDFKRILWEEGEFYPLVTGTNKKQETRKSTPVCAYEVSGDVMNLPRNDYDVTTSSECASQE